MICTSVLFGGFGKKPDHRQRVILRPDLEIAVSHCRRFIPYPLSFILFELAPDFKGRAGRLSNKKIGYLRYKFSLYLTGDQRFQTFQSLQPFKRCARFKPFHRFLLLLRRLVP
jgi:hypothetical protein